MKKLRLIALFLALIFVLSACGKNSGGQQSNADPGSQPGTDSGGPAGDGGITITAGIAKLPTSFNLIEYGTSIQMQLVFEGLFRVNPSTGDVEPMLADSWDYIDDLTLKIKLRDDVYFACGEKLTADTVLHSLSSYTDPSKNSTQAMYYFVYDFENSYAEDDLTLILKTHAPYGPGIANLARNPDIFCKSCYDGFSDADLWDHACGTGPYSVVENVSGSHSTLSLRGDYWNKAKTPAVDTFTIRGYSEVSTMFIDFENGALDVVFTLDDSSYQRLLAGGVQGATVKAPSLYDLYYITLPEYVEAFNDVRVREAFTIAVDWAIVGDIALGSLAELPTSNVSSTAAPFYVNQGAYKYDPDRARQLLADAGYPDGGVVLNCLVSTLPTEMRVFESMQGYLSEVGIDMRFEAFESSSVMPRIAGGETDLFILGPMAGTPVTDPALTMTHAHAGAFLRPCVISDPVYNGYWDTGSNSIDQATRIEAYKNAQEWLHNNYRHIPIIEPKTAFAFHNSVIADLDVNNTFNPSLIWLKLA